MLLTTIALAAAAPSASADATVSAPPAHVVLDHPADRPAPATVATDAATYASREAKDTTIAKFRGGSAVLIIGGSTVAVVLIVVLILVLL